MPCRAVHTPIHTMTATGCNLIIILTDPHCKDMVLRIVRDAGATRNMLSIETNNTIRFELSAPSYSQAYIARQLRAQIGNGFARCYRRIVDPRSLDSSIGLAYFLAALPSEADAYEITRALRDDDLDVRRIQGDWVAFITELGAKCGHYLFREQCKLHDVDWVVLFEGLQ